MILEAMNTIDLKTDLHQLIDKINDVKILNAIKVILSKESKIEADWAYSLSDDLKTELEDSILEADLGKTITHDNAMKQIKDSRF